MIPSASWRMPPASWRRALPSIADTSNDVLDLSAAIEDAAREGQGSRGVAAILRAGRRGGHGRQKQRGGDAKRWTSHGS